MEINGRKSKYLNISFRIERLCVVQSPSSMRYVIIFVGQVKGSQLARHISF